MTSKDAAKYLNVSLSYIYHLRESGKIEGTYKNGWNFSEKTLNSFKRTYNINDDDSLNNELITKSYCITKENTENINKLAVRMKLSNSKTLNFILTKYFS